MSLDQPSASSELNVTLPLMPVICLTRARDMPFLTLLHSVLLTQPGVPAACAGAAVSAIGATTAAAARWSRRTSGSARFPTPRPTGMGRGAQPPSLRRRVDESPSEPPAPGLWISAANRSLCMGCPHTLTGSLPPCWHYANRLLDTSPTSLQTAAMTKPSYSRLDAGQRRDEILDAANVLFAERGYEEVSIGAIATSAGVTRGLVHHYFGGRRRSTSRWSIALASCARKRCGSRSATPRPSVWLTPSLAGWIGQRPTARSGSPRWRLARTSPTPTSGVVSDLVRRAVRLLASFHSDIAEDTARLQLRASSAGPG